MIFLSKKQRIYDYFYEFASEALHIVIFENFIKSMSSCLSKLKVTPCVCFPIKIHDNPTASTIYIIKTPLIVRTSIGTVFPVSQKSYFWKNSCSTLCMQKLPNKNPITKLGVAHKVGPYPDHKFLGVSDEFLAILFEPSFTDANDDLEGTTTNLYW